GAAGAPVVENYSFERDRFAVWPGVARGNNGAITGWFSTGNVGINPVYPASLAPRQTNTPFFDNGAAPDGRQVAFIQGPGRLAQRIPGFRKGCRYVVLYRENTRVQRQGNEWPRVRVLLGEKVVVSPHEVTPVARAGDHSVPFYRVESAPFVAPEDGAFELVFETVQGSATTTLLLDAVEIREVPPTVSETPQR
ncbi:MAG: hypothetical protein QHJ73_18515, partial [Armatimonadota bacterium]|nr:hypothetical protein [Armatimonadota bacterium]